MITEDSVFSPLFVSEGIHIVMTELNMMNRVFAINSYCYQEKGILQFNRRTLVSQILMFFS